MRDRALSKILKAEQRFVRGFANLADGLDAGSIEHVPDPRCKSDMVDRRIVWKFWGRVEEHDLFHT
jgi:hypothetical protein